MVEGRYVWFEDVRVVLEGLRPMCVVAGRSHPLPVTILHPDCTLTEVGDVGRLGVPQWWAKQRGLLRHTFATLHILAGKPAAWVSRQLGHADVTVTLKVYAKAFEMVDATAADEHGARLFPAESVGSELAVERAPAPPPPAIMLH